MYYKEVMLSEVEVLEEHTNVYKVSDREMELQREYGYPVDKIPYWKTLKGHTTEGSIKGKIKGGKIGGKIGGLIGGKRTVELGHLAKAQKISSIARRTPISQYTKDGNFIKEFISQAEAAEELNIPFKCINNNLKGISKTTGGFVFRYVTELTC